MTTPTQAITHCDCDDQNCDMKRPDVRGLELAKLLRQQASRKTIQPEHDLMLAAAVRIENDYRIYRSSTHD